MRHIIPLLLISFCASAQNIPFYGNIVPADSTGYDLGRSSLHWDTVFYNVLIPSVGSASDTSLWQLLGGSRIEPKNQKSVTIDKNLTVGDGVGSDSIYANISIGLIQHATSLYILGTNSSSDFSATWLSDSNDSSYSIAGSYANTAGLIQVGRYKYQFGAWNDPLGAPFTELSIYDTLTATDRIRVRLDTFNGVTAFHDSILFQIDRFDNVFVGGDSNVSILTSSGAVQIGNKGRSQGLLRLMEDDDNGSNYIQLQSPASLTSNWTLTLPADDGSANQVLQTNGSGVTTWATVGTGTGFTIDASNNMYGGDGGDAGDEGLGAAGNVVVGSLSGGISNGTLNTIVGFVSSVVDSTTNNAVIVGSTSSAASDATALGYDAYANFSQSIALGAGTRTTAANQLVIGSGAPINDVYIGSGVTSTGVISFALNATGGSGTNIAGASITIAGGKGTGNATTGGDINFATSDAGASGTTLQSLTNKLIIKKSGNIQVPIMPSDSTGLASGTLYYNASGAIFRKF